MILEAHLLRNTVTLPDASKIGYNHDSKGQNDILLHLQIHPVKALNLSLTISYCPKDNM